MSIVVFEDDRWPDFAPLSQTRHLSQMIVGTGSILQGIAAEAGDADVALAGRGYLADVVRAETGFEYNAPLDDWALLMNGRINPSLDLERWTSRRGGGGGFVVMDRGQVAVASLGAEAKEAVFSDDGTVSQAALVSATKGLERLESPDPILFSYPWEMMATNGKAIEASLAGKRTKKGEKKRKGGTARKQAGGADRAMTTGKKKKKAGLVISRDAQVDDFVSLDARAGPIIIEDGVHVESFSMISGPCFIGRDTVLHSALVREGTTIGENCRIGGEIENSIIYPYTNKAHLGFLGHAVVGSWVNLGAGSVTSDLKNTYGTVKVKRGGERVDSGLVKLGPMLGDMAKVSIGTMVYGGNSIGVSARCAGLVDRDIPDFVQFVGGVTSDLRLDALLITQSRMMERRRQKLSEERKKLIEYLHGACIKSETPGAEGGADKQQQQQPASTRAT